MTQPFADRLAAAVETKRSALVVGLDPQLEKLPSALVAAARTAHGDVREAAAAAIASFDAAVIGLVAPFAVAIKPQIAFYEQWGPPGLAAFELAITRAHEADLLVIGDVKRGDIGSTAAAYAAAHLGPDVEDAGSGSFADAITVNPFFGTDGVAPFLDAARRRHAGLFVLVRTSNASAAELQDLPVRGRPLHEHIAELVCRWGANVRGASGYSSIGAVVGATAPLELKHLRSCMPHAWLLIPGVGAQGATAADVSGAFDQRGLGALVNSSRGVIYAFGSPTTTDWQRPIREAARRLRDEIRAVATQAVH